MAKVIAITDLKGELLGVVRAEPVNLGNGLTIQAVHTLPKHITQQRHHIIEVPDNLLGKRGSGVEELHREVRRRLPK